MSVSLFANALRTHSRLRVLTATRVALPVTRSISSLVAFRTAVPKNVSLSVSRLFMTSQVARNDLKDDARGTAASSIIFVARISPSTTEEELTKFFSEFGEVTRVRLHMTQAGNSRGMANVDFTSKESAVATIESATLKPIHLRGRDLHVDYSKFEPFQARPVTDPSDRLYFSGCAGNESEIRTIFNQFNDSIIDIDLLKNPRTRKRASAGFVQFKSIETATEALEALHGTQTPDGEQLNVVYARPRRSQSTPNSP